MREVWVEGSAHSSPTVGEAGGIGRSEEPETEILHENCQFGVNPGPEEVGRSGECEAGVDKILAARIFKCRSQGSTYRVPSLVVR
jgi:hypothetical protein